jgi:hypothetical protein
VVEEEAADIAAVAVVAEGAVAEVMVAAVVAVAEDGDKQTIN